MSYLDFKKIISSLTVEDVIKVMTDLGSETHKRQGNTLILESICHGSKSHKLYYYHDATDRYPANTLHCYSGCSCSYTLPSLIQKIKGCNVYEAYDYITKITGNVCYTDVGNPIEITNDFSFINKIKKRKNTSIPVLDRLNENVLDLFVPYPYIGWLEEGITYETMLYFEIGYFGKENSITIPHRDINGSLVGVRQRYIDKRDVEAIGKYVPVCIEGKFLRHNLGDTFYGIWQHKEAIIKYKKAVLFEGEKSVLLSHTYYGENDCSLAVCGSNITNIHIKILVEALKVETVIIAFDKEFIKADSLKADAYRNKIYKKIKPLLGLVNVEIIWDDKDLLEEKDSPVDKGIETYEKLYNDRKRIIAQDLEVLNDFRKD